MVLETDEDYVRFDIAQDRLSPILTVTSAGVELKARADLNLSPLPAGLSIEQLESLGLEGNNQSADNESCTLDQSECNLLKVPWSEVMALDGQIAVEGHTFVVTIKCFRIDNICTKLVRDFVEASKK